MAVPIVLPEPEFTRRKILLMTFKAMQADAPLTTDAAEHPRNIEYVTMLCDEGLLTPCPGGYTLTRAGIAHWHEIVSAWSKQGHVVGRDTSLAVLRSYDANGIKVEVEA